MQKIDPPVFGIKYLFAVESDRFLLLLGRERTVRINDVGQMEQVSMGAGSFPDLASERLKGRCKLHIHMC